MSRLPLRVKLVATLCLLLLIALAATAAVATAQMRGYLLDRVDTQLFDATADHHPPRGGGPPGGDRDQPPSAFYIQTFDSTGNPQQVLGRPVSASDDAPDVPKLTVFEVVERAGKPFTVGSVSGGDDWRVIMVPDGDESVAFASSLEDVNNTVSRLASLLGLIGAGALLLLGGTGYVLVRRSLRPLVEVETTAAAIADGDLSQRVPDADPRTEVGRLSGALNGMLGQIEMAFTAQTASESAARASEERMRRFVADASHELRTPLTSIRGFAELYRQGAVADPADVQRVMRRIEDEARRMGLLVEDLLLLARLDEQRPLERLPVDLVALAADAVHDARAVAPDHVVEIAVETADVSPVVIGDEARLRQVIGNLVNNALVHTPVGTRVVVRLTTSAGEGFGDDEEPGPEQPVHRGWAHLDVADDGPGLSPQDASRVFERFYRADSARTRATGGSGLGLSIVAALTAAHGGLVDVSSAPGIGTTFRIMLPLSDDPPDPAAGELARRRQQRV